MMDYEPRITKKANTLVVQPRLKIGQPGDKYEKEADATSDRVMSMSQSDAIQMQPLEEEEEMLQPQIQMQPLEEEEELLQPKIQMQEEDEEEMVQMKPMKPDQDSLSTANPFGSSLNERETTSEVINKKPDNGLPKSKSLQSFSSQLQNNRGNGTKLSNNVGQEMSSKFGYAFNNVQVHKDENAIQMAEQINAKAFTYGSDIYFGRNQFNPNSSKGKHLLAHELTHVVQQNKAGTKNRNESSPRKANESNKNNNGYSLINNDAPSIQADWAIEPPNSGDPTVVLTPQQIQDAIDYNNAKLGRADPSLIHTIRDVLGISGDPPVIDADFVNAVQRWQTAYNISQDGKLGPDSAGPLFRELRAEGLSAESRTLAGFIRKGRVATNPTYTGSLVPVPSGGTQSVTFNFTTEFDHDPDNGIFASCCEVRQQIQWDATLAASFAATGNPVPHGGFPAAHPAGRWTEDRNATNTLRYGHRGGFGGAVAGNRYVNADGTTLNQANGTHYQGQDTPTMLTADTGQMRFRVYVVDICNGNTRISPFNTITINW